MNWDQSIITAISIFVAFSMVVWFIPVVWRARENLDERTVAAFVLGCCIGLGSLFLNEHVYLFVGRVSHIPNLNWLLSFCFTVMSVYSLIVLTSETLQTDPVQVKKLGYITAMFVIVLVLTFFLGGIAFSTPNLVRADARSLAELIFMNTAYLYQVVIYPVPLMLSIRMLLSSHSLNARIRSAAFFVAIFAAMMYCTLRILKTIVVFYAPSTSPFVINNVQIVLWLLFAIALFLWPIAFVPTGWLEFFLQINQLIHLNYLYKRINEGCSHAPSISIPKLWEQVRQAGFYINMICVFILDVKWLDSQKRLEFDDDDVALVIGNLDDSLSQEETIAECVKQSQFLRYCERTRDRKKIKGESYA